MGLSVSRVLEVQCLMSEWCFGSREIDEAPLLSQKTETTNTLEAPDDCVIEIRPEVSKKVT